MIGLNRSLAPLSERAWQQLEADVRGILALHFAARRLVDFEGPLGWEHSAIDLGQVEALEGAGSGTGRIRKRAVRPLIELRVPFEIEREAIEGIDRGAGRVDTGELDQAARDFAAAEDTAIFEGYAAAEIPGLLTDAEDPGLPLHEDIEELPATVAAALERLRQAGVEGPYALALGPSFHEALQRSHVGGGYPLSKHVCALLDGPVIWAPALRGGLLLSLRGGDFRLVCGRDASVGYASHDEQRVRLFLEESFSFVLDGPEAVIPLLPGEAEAEASSRS